MHFEKFNIDGVGGLLRHIFRDNENYSNESIDPKKTALNYDLCDNPIKSQTELKNALIEHCESLKGHLKKNAVAMVGLLVTMPKDEKDPEAFFKACYNYLSKKFPHIITASVHMDETTPHMHYDFSPITKDNRLCAKEIINRNMLRSFHQEMEKAISKELGHEVHLLNGATSQGHKTILELKIEELERKKEELLTSVIDIKDKQLNLTNDYNLMVDKFNVDFEKSKNFLIGVQKEIDVKKNELPNLNLRLENLKNTKMNLIQNLKKKLENISLMPKKILSAEDIKNKVMKESIPVKVIPKPVKKTFDRGR